jgi:subtilisin family serine protease
MDDETIGRRPPDQPPATSGEPRERLSCLGLLLPLIWLAGSALLFGIGWLSQQFAAATTGAEAPWWLWPILGLVQGLAVFVPALALARRERGPRLRAAYQLWAGAGLFSLLALPIHTLPDTAGISATLVQIGCALLFLLVIERVWFRAPGPGRRGPYWPAFLVAALIAWPWVLWGALGSALETLLSLLSALLLGLSAGRLLGHTVLKAFDLRQSTPALAAGAAATVALALMGVAYGYGGQRLMLFVVLGAAGWAAISVAGWGRGAEPARGWAAAALFVSLVAAGPMLFIDPDELSLLLNLGSRDVAFYAVRATFLSVPLALAAGFGLWLASGSNRVGREGPGGRIAAAAAWVGLALLFVFAGQRGWNGERLFVILREQADLSAVAAIADPVERRAAAYETLVSTAERTQPGLLETLSRLGIDATPYYLVNGLEVDGGPLLRWWLGRRPEVDRVIGSPQLRPLPEPPPMAQGSEPAPASPEWNLALIRAPEVWDALGVTGEGIIIGQSDSGVDGRHPELAGGYRGAADGAVPGDDYNWLDPWYDTPSPVDIGGHGTHTLGSALGRSVGVAPGATWIGCVNLARNLGNPADYLNCLEFLFAPFPQGGDPFADGRPDLGAQVLNNSWGCPEVEGCDPNALLAAADALRAAGVFVVVSAGNNGDRCETVADPLSLYDAVFSVGSVDSAGALSTFSSRGPVTADGSGRIKPDIVAPGEGVLSAFPGGTYSTSSGTSMAGPHVAGVVALMWSSNPALIGNIDLTERLLIDTAQPYDAGRYGVPNCGEAGPGPDNAVGHGLVDAFAAVEAAQRASGP